MDNSPLLNSVNTEGREMMGGFGQQTTDVDLCHKQDYVFGF